MPRQVGPAVPATQSRRLIGPPRIASQRVRSWRARRASSTSSTAARSAAPAPSSTPAAASRSVNRAPLARRAASATRRVQVLRACVGQRPHRLVAEDRLQHLLAQRRRCRRRPPPRPPVSPPVCAKTTIITSSPAPLTAEGEASRAAVRLLCALLARPARARRPASRGPRARRASASSGDAAAQVGVAEQRARRPGRPRHAARGPLRGRVGRRPDQRLDAGLQRLGQLVAGRGRPLHAARHPVAQPADPRLAASRISSPVPTNSCQRASTSPRSSDAVADWPRRRRAGAASYAASTASPQRRRGRGLLVGRGARAPAPAAPGCARAPSRVCRTTAARAAASRGQPVQPGPHRRDDVRRAAGASTACVSGTTNSGALAEPAARSASGRGGRATSLGRLRRHPVEDHGQRGAARRAPRAATPTARRRRSGRRS